MSKAPPPLKPYLKLVTFALEIEPLSQSASSHCECDELVPKPRRFYNFNVASHVIRGLFQEAAMFISLHICVHSYMLVPKTSSPHVDVLNMVTYLN